MADIRTEDVTYTAGDTTCRGHIAYDGAAGGPRPGVLVVHEWWGLDDYIRGRTRLLAELGYTALAADMYGDGQTAGDPDGAGALMNAVLGNMDAGTARFKAAYDALAGHPAADAGRMAAIGYCFGGAMVLHGARIGMDLKGVVSFHGSLGSFHKPAKGRGEGKGARMPWGGRRPRLRRRNRRLQAGDGGRRRRLPLCRVRGCTPRLHQSRSHRER